MNSPSEGSSVKPLTPVPVLRTSCIKLVAHVNIFRWNITDECLQRRWIRRIDYRAGTAIHAVSSGKHVLARLQYVGQSDIVLVLDHVNPKDLQNKKNLPGGNSCNET
jgi:hypothetical protein